MRKEYSSGEITGILTTHNAGIEFVTGGLSRAFFDFIQTKLEPADRLQVLKIPDLQSSFRKHGVRIPDWSVEAAQDKEEKLKARAAEQVVEVRPIDIPQSWEDFEGIESPEQQMEFLSNPDFVGSMVSGGNGGRVLDAMMDFKSSQVADMLTADGIGRFFATPELKATFAECVGMLKDPDQRRVRAVPGLKEALEELAPGVK